MIGLLWINSRMVTEKPKKAPHTLLTTNKELERRTMKEKRHENTSKEHHLPLVRP